jgi:hypothetical protein
MLLRDRSHAVVLFFCAVAAFAAACDDEVAVVPGNLEGDACHPETGARLPGVVVEARGALTKKVAANAAGHFLFKNLPPGEYAIVALVDGTSEHRIGDATTLVQSGETLPVLDTACDIPPPAPDAGTLNGQVCDRHTGGLVAQAAVIVHLQNGDDMDGGHTDDQGNFSVENVPVGEHVVSIRAPGFSRSFPFSIDAKGDVFTLDIADGCEAPSSTSGSIAGEFCDPATDGPLAGASVLVHRLDPASTTAEDVHDLTDTEGQFFVGGLLPGSYRVDVEKPGVPPRTEQVIVRSGETATVVGPDECARRTPIGRIEGEICDIDAGGRFVGTVQLLQGATIIQTTNSDAAGRFAFNEVAPGTYDLHAFRDGYSRDFRSIVVEPFQVAFIQETNCPEPADVCEEFTHQPDVVSDGRILFVVDRSGSMGFTATGFAGQTKISALRTAVAQVTTSLASSVTFGLFAYPNPTISGGDIPSACSAGVQLHAVGAGAAAINASLSGLQPQGGTPTAQSVLAARTVLPTLVADGRPIAVVLATDGAPNCETTETQKVACQCTSHDNGETNQACSRFNCLDAVNSANAVAQIAALGVQTHVVGLRGTDENTFDSNNDGVSDFTDALNSMAIAGQAPLPGTVKFHEATSPAALAAALDAITHRILACKITVDANLNTASSVRVTLGDDVLAQDIRHVDGWDITGPNTIELFGASCDTATASGDTVVVTRCEDGG